METETKFADNAALYIYAVSGIRTGGAGGTIAPPLLVAQVKILLASCYRNLI